MSYQPNGNLLTDKRTVDESETWDSQAEWEAFQESNSIEIVDGSLQLAETVIPDSVVHRYRFEGDAVDDVGSLDGTVNGATFTSNDPLEGSQSLVTDGSDDDVSFPSGVGIDETVDGITFEFLIEFDSVSSGVGVFEFDANNTQFFAFFQNDDNLRFSYRSTGNNPATDVPVTTGTAYHVTCQYVASTGAVEIYLDETLQDSNDSGGSLDDTRGDNRWGSQDDRNRWLEATSDDLRIHDEAIL